MTSRRVAALYRAGLLGAGILCLVGMFLLPAVGTGTPLGPPLNHESWRYVALVFGVLLVTQWLFLCPRGKLRMHLADRGRPMWTSIVTAAMAATLLSTATVATLLEVPDWWPGFFPLKEPVAATLICTVMAGVWVAWSFVFYIYWRGVDREAYLSKMLRWLIAGSILELLVAAPMHVAKRSHCYCARGSFTGLVLGGTVLLWAFGPGIVLLLIRDKRRQELRRIREGQRRKRILKERRDEWPGG